MANQIHQINSVVLIFVLGLMLLSSKCTTSDEVEITVINEMQACEENNFYYRIIRTNKPVEILRNPRDSLVLFVFSDNLKSKHIYDLFYPAYTKKRKELVVKGFFLNEKTGLNNPYGCPGSSKFKITDTVSIKDITEQAAFPVTNE